MWTVPLHLSGPVCGVVAVLIVLGVSARPVFRYPHIWRYLEARLLARHDCAPGIPRCDCDPVRRQHARRCPAVDPPHGRTGDSFDKASGNLPDTFVVLILTRARRPR
jgi:hypothetical protein